MESPRRRKWGELAGLAAILLLALAGTIPRYAHHVVDDSYISFRYARNLVEGHGLVFNPGERVEGYTNFSWTLLVALGMRLGLSPEVWARALGMVSGAALLLFLARWGAKRWSVATGLLASAFLALDLTFAAWCTAGLETPLFGLLVFAGVALAADALDGRRARGIGASALLLALATLTRPEGILYLALVGIAHLAWPDARTERKARLVPWALALGLLLLHELWRIAYYGAWLPNTFAAKVTDATGLRLVPRGWHYAAEFVRELRAWALLPLVGLLPAARGTHTRGSTLLVAAAVLGFVHPVLLGGDGLTAFRFFFPVLPFLFLGIARGTVALAERTARAPAQRIAFAALLACAPASALLAPHVRSKTLVALRREEGEVAAWRAIGAWFAANTAPEARIAVVVAGAIPYFSERPCIDLLGLTDRTIARTPIPRPGEGQAGHERSNAPYVLERAPDYVVIGEYALHPTADLRRPQLSFYYRAEEDLVRAPGFDAYRLAIGRTPGGYFHYFERRAERANPAGGPEVE